ncbi:unnamed protein product [Linum trigynum]|uniref:Clp ATPase C-terminal domain-containing protein n=1 Tax=Linum trigynum TaxID=586398 RepID=A0AAV2G6Z9_9ROSI
MELPDLEQRLMIHIIGQDEAVKAVSRVARRSRTGVRNPSRPLASFLFAGPSSVGKAKLANALAIEFYGSSHYSVIRFDMGDYDRKHLVSHLTDSIIRKPRSVILFHGIENAHRDVGHALLRIVDDGTLTNQKGQRGDFRNAIIVMTFDIVQPEVIRTFRTGNDVQRSISQFLSGILGAQISSRIDEVLLFNEVTREHVEQIVEVMVREFTGRVRGRKCIEVEVTSGMKRRVVEEGYDPSCGAKPLKSAFTRLVEDPLADAILDGRIVRGGRHVTLDYQNHPIVVSDSSSV